MCHESVQRWSAMLRGDERLDRRKSVPLRNYCEMLGAVAKSRRGRSIRLSRVLGYLAGTSERANARVGINAHEMSLGARVDGSAPAVLAAKMSSGSALVRRVHDGTIQSHLQCHPRGVVVAAVASVSLSTVDEGAGLSTGEAWTEPDLVVELVLWGQPAPLESVRPRC